MVLRRPCQCQVPSIYLAVEDGGADGGQVRLTCFLGDVPSGHSGCWAPSRSQRLN